jgi:hypothetical protein
VRVVLPSLAFATLASADVSAVTAVHPYGGHQAYFCEYPKSVTAEGHTVTTPTICVPSP